MQIDVIDPKKTAMIVVDMQNDFVASGAVMETPAARAVVPKLADALKVCRDAGIKVIYTAHAHRRDGSDWDSLMTCILRSLIVRHWSMARRGWTSTLSWRRRLVSMSSRSIVTAAFLARTWTSSCANGVSIP